MLKNVSFFFFNAQLPCICLLMPVRYGIVSAETPKSVNATGLRAKISESPMNFCSSCSFMNGRARAVDEMSVSIRHKLRLRVRPFDIKLIL